jgi:hypothetical protein
MELRNHCRLLALASTAGAQRSTHEYAQLYIAVVARPDTIGAIVSLTTSQGMAFRCNEAQPAGANVNLDRAFFACFMNMRHKFEDLKTVPAPASPPDVYDPLFLTMIGRLGWDVYAVEPVNRRVGVNDYAAHMYYLRR